MGAAVDYSRCSLLEELRKTTNKLSCGVG